MAIIMAILIVAALAVIIVTIYSRLTAANSAKAIQQSELVIPADSRITGASLGDKGQMLVIIEDKTGQQFTGFVLRRQKYLAPARRHAPDLLRQKQHPNAIASVLPAAPPESDKKRQACLQGLFAAPA